MRKYTQPGITGKVSFLASLFEYLYFYCELSAELRWQGGHLVSETALPVLKLIFHQKINFPSSYEGKQSNVYYEYIFICVCLQVY